MLKSSKRVRVVAALNGILPAGKASAAQVAETQRLLAAGSSEEQLVGFLAGIAARDQDPMQLEAAARALLKIGVRTRGSRSPRGPCSACGVGLAFSWACPCGFRICQACVDENSWGLTCNGITWECPDCGRFRGF